MDHTQRRLALLTVVACLAVAAGAFLYAQVRKTAATPVARPIFAAARFFSPNDDGVRDQARFSFRLRAAQKIDVDVVDTGGHVVRSLLEAAPRRGTVRLDWDGRDDAGQVAPDGPYRVRVHLGKEGTTTTIPSSITIDTVFPTVRATPPPTGEFTAGLPGPAGRFSFRAAPSEPVALRLLVQRVGLDGKASRVFEERETKSGANPRLLTWSGETGIHATGGRASKTLVPGSYIVGWVATDRAGNRVQAPAVIAPGQLAPASVVQVDTVALYPPDLRVETRLPGAVVERFTAADPLPGPPVDAQAAGLHAVRATAGDAGTGVRTAWAPEAVPGTDTTLVVVPTYSWALRNPFDADRNGFPDVLDGTASLDWPTDPATADRLRRLAKVVQPVAPPGGYGAITDAAIEDGGVPAGVQTLIVSHLRAWTPALADRLRAFQRAGGQVLVRKSPLDIHVARDGRTIRRVGDEHLDLER